MCFPPIINGLIRSNYTVYFWLSNLVPIFHLLRVVVFQMFVPSFPTSFIVWPIIPATEVYVFQFLCYAVWPQTGLVNLALFLVWTYASAYLLAKCVQQPIQRLELVHNIFLGERRSSFEQEGRGCILKKGSLVSYTGFCQSNGNLPKMPLCHFSGSQWNMIKFTEGFYSLSCSSSKDHWKDVK